MPYNPLNGTVTDKPLALATGAPDGARSYFYDEANDEFRPFVSEAEVKAYLNTPDKRKGHFPIIINTGGTLADGIITGGTNAEWWFKDGVADGNLVLKASGGGGGGGGIGNIEGGNID